MGPRVTACRPLRRRQPVRSAMRGRTFQDGDVGLQQEVFHAIRKRSL